MVVQNIRPVISDDECNKGVISDDECNEGENSEQHESSETNHFKKTQELTVKSNHYDSDTDPMSDVPEPGTSTPKAPIPQVRRKKTIL